jgi:Spy/CpxP family protein refolding chaperone
MPKFLFFRGLGLNGRACRRLVLVLTLVLAAVPMIAQSQPPATRPPAASAAKPAPAAGLLPAPPPWWKSESFTKALNLTTDQSNQIQTIFHDTQPTLRQHMSDLDVLEDRLSKMIAKNDTEPKIIQQISEVELKRSALNITRSVMLYHMREVLKPQQRVKFDVLHQQWQDEVFGPWQDQQERLQRDQRLKGEPRVGPQARPTPDPQKRPQQQQ